MWARGGSLEGMAALFSTSEAEVQAIVDEGMDRQPDLADIDGERMVKEIVVKVGALMEEAAQAAVAGDPKDRIAASRLRLQALQWMFVLHQSVGVLPSDLGRFAVEIDVKRMGMKMWDYMQAKGIDDEIIAGLADHLDPRPPAIAEVDGGLDEEEEALFEELEDAA